MCNAACRLAAAGAHASPWAPAVSSPPRCNSTLSSAARERCIVALALIQYYAQLLAGNWHWNVALHLLQSIGTMT